ncbi:MAG: choice-of-anchor J domain-containing protein, partial [Bacteroidota bacterium]
MEQEGDPIITINETDFDGNFGSFVLPDGSGAPTNVEVRTYSVSAIDLLGDLIISAPDGFVISQTDTDFETSVALSPTDGDISATTISVIFNPSEEGAFEGSITHASTDAITKSVAVSGTGLSSTTIYFEDFTTCPSAMTTFSVASNEDWECTTAGNTNNAMQANGFGGDVASDDWLITPSIDLTSVDNAALSFFSWTNFADAVHPPIKVLISTDYSGTGDPTSANWDELDATFAEQDSETWTESGAVELFSYIGGSVYIAFQYTSTGTEGSSSSEWRIDDVLVEEVGSPEPFLSVNDDNFNGDFQTQDVNTVSTSTSFIVEGFDLTDGITITPPAQFEVSV